MRVLSAESTELFVGPPDAPLQLARITYTDCGQPTPSASTATAGR
ncbi:family 5 glycosyl hydrolase domain protein [Mycobacterium xenopi 4042]|uniref:Family 5 glycosyl hydrolase domain protein n=1 Tax=Mycobacterium xenopi 4042 TaxID=1299334 RepID=X8EC73_MYCXE|nr:family 5 glycosyl hydrolase domain protein [Mycobacterium xenopi 4042]